MPSGLEVSQQVWLVVEQVDYVGNIILNDEPLGQQKLGEPSFRSEVRSLLRPANVLAIEIDLPIDAGRGERKNFAGGLIGSVRLEIAQ